MLKIKDLRVTYKIKDVISIPEVSFKHGEITGILGLNGAGKTTMLKAILNLVAYSGSVDLDEWNIDRQYDQVAYISEEYSFIPYYTPYKYGHYMMDYYPSFDFQRYQMICEKFDIDMDKKIEKMSRGQQLKVEIAAGYAQHAKLIIMDEPFTNLDIISKEKAVKMLINILEGDEIVLLATHDLDEVENILDRCVILDNGVLIDDFHVEKLHEKGKSLRDYFRILTNG